MAWVSETAARQASPRWVAARYTEVRRATEDSLRELAERFRLDGPLSFFDTLVDCQAPINPYAHRRHHIDRSMLIGAPEFRDARRAFLRFAQGAVLVEHSHDAFDTWLVGRGLLSKRRDCNMLTEVRLHKLLNLLLEFFGRRKRCFRHR